MVSQERLKELLIYYPGAGVFIARVYRPRAVYPGDVVGNLNRKGYLQHMVDGRRYALHRLAFIYMEGNYPAPPLEIDHINGDKTDNRWANLRAVSHLKNMENWSSNVKSKKA